MNQGKPFAHLTEQQREHAMAAVVERVMDGETMLDIAAEFGVTRHRLYQLLAVHAQDAWKSSQIARALMNLDDAEESLPTCKDLVELGAARERIKSAQWQLEKLHRRLFGNDQPSNSGQVVQINIEITRDQPAAIGNATVVTPE